MEYYQHTTRSQARAALSTRLEDPNNVRWLVEELNLYLADALRLWQALTGSYHDRSASISTQNAVAFYDLATIPAASLGCTLLDSDQVKTLQYHLLEPATGTSWTGSDQFNLTQVTQALQKRRDRFLLETGIVQSYSLLATAVPIPNNGRVPLPVNCIDVRRLAWKDGGGTFYPLWRNDEFALNSFSPGWLTPGVPSTYSAIVAPPLLAQLAPPPASPGSLECITVDSGAALNPAAGVLMGIPDDFVPFVKWGALADLLSLDGKAYDPVRAAYAESVYALGVTLAIHNPSVIQLSLNGTPLFLSSVFDLDAFSPGWQNAPAAPSQAAMSGRNLLAFAGIPNGVYSVVLDLVPNMPVPALDTNYLQVGKEVLDAILDYAQHLAMFKNGGAEFAGSTQLFQNLLKLAGVQNRRLQAMATYRRILDSPSTRQENTVPRTVPRIAEGSNA